MVDANMVQHARNDGVGQFLQSFGAGIKIRIWGQHDGSCLQEQFHVFYVYKAKRSFTRAEDEFFIFLEHHIGGSQECILTEAVSYTHLTLPTKA